MLSVKVDASSLKALQGQLGSIKKSLANRGMKKALGEMGKIFRDGLKREVPTRSGLLKRSITFKVWKAKKNGQYMAKVGAKNIKGAALHRHKKTGKYVVATTAKQHDRAKGNANLSPVKWSAKLTGGNSVNPAHYLHLVDGGAKAHDVTSPFPYGRRHTMKHPGFKGRGMLAKVAAQRGAQATAAAVASLEQSIKEATISSG